MWPGLVQFIGKMSESPALPFLRATTPWHDQLLHKRAKNDYLGDMIGGSHPVNLKADVPRSLSQRMDRWLSVEHFGLKKTKKKETKTQLSNLF